MYFFVEYESFGVSHYICSQPLDPIGIHLLCYAHGGEMIISHDVM
jgi:hypothetical protein